MEIEVNPKVSEWLLEQPWRGQFIDNCIKENRSPSEVLQLILGRCGDETINEGFTWIDTPEDYDFWFKLNNELEEKFEEEDWNDYWKEIEI